jgi:hypothetical protein
MLPANAPNVMVRARGVTPAAARVSIAANVTRPDSAPLVADRPNVGHATVLARRSAGHAGVTDGARYAKAAALFVSLLAARSNAPLARVPVNADPAKVRDWVTVGNAADRAHVPNAKEPPNVTFVTAILRANYAAATVTARPARITTASVPIARARATF